MAVDRFARLWEPRLRRHLVLGLIVLGLTTVPLVGALGYENAFVTSPLFGLLGVGVGVDGIRRARSLPEPGRPALSGLLALGLAELGTLHVLALALLLLGRLWQSSCDPTGGFVFHLAGPVCSSLVGLVCGLWGGTLARARWTQILFGVAPMLLFLGVGLVRLYRHPVVFAYDPFWGYFSGSVYDEDVGVGLRYWRYRGYNGLALLTALAAFGVFVDTRTFELVRPRPSRTNAVLAVITLGGIVTVGAIFLRAASYGFTATTASITEHLSGTYETEHFVIHYAPRSPSAAIIEDVALEHEFAWARLHAIMGRAPDRKIESFLFTTPQQKRALMGAGTVQVAAPWRYQIYLDERGFPHPVLHHELVHVFAATIGDPVFGVARSGVRINMGLVEGLATALAPRASDRLDLHDQAKLLDALGVRPSLAAIMGPGFLAEQSRVAYTAAGSFCRYLVDTQGFEKMAALYRNAGDFEAAYGRPLAALEAEWLAFLRAYPGLRDADVKAHAQLFKRGSVFARPCAHRVAEVRELLAQAANRGRLDEVVEHHRELCRLEPENPLHLLGLATSLAEAERFDEAYAVLDRAGETPDLTVTVQSSIAERRGDVALTAGRLGEAAEAYAAALALPKSEAEQRVLELKHRGATDPELAPLIVRYLGLFEGENDGLTAAITRLYAALQIREHGRWQALGHYLVARQLLNAHQAELAHPLLEQSLADPNALPSREFVQAARLALVTTSLLTRRFDQARRVLADWLADPELSNGHRLEGELWRERIEFFARATSPS